MVRIRMKAMGRRHQPFFRICAMDARTPRDGRAIEELGWYDPLVRNPEARERLDASRIRYWLSVGAQPTPKVAAILKRHGVQKPAPGEPWELPEAERYVPRPKEEPATAEAAPAQPASLTSAPASAPTAPTTTTPPAES